jgi:GR25 family glycosyltransferase involved in LPS biosynthesis
MSRFNTYFINLPQSHTRRAAIEKRLKQSGVSYIRISGEKPEELLEGNAFVTKPVMGCWESHLKCYRESIQFHEQFSLIFEDDAQINSKILTRVSQAVERKAINGVDLLQLGYVSTSAFESIKFRISDFFWLLEVYLLHYGVSFLKKFHVKMNYNRIRINRASEAILLSRSLKLGMLRPDHFLPGTHAYLISRNFAMTVQNFNQNPQLFSADLFYMSLSSMCTFQIWRTCRFKIKQDKKLPSEINFKRFKRFEG